MHQPHYFYVKTIPLADSKFTITLSIRSVGAIRRLRSLTVASPRLKGDEA